MRAHAEMYGLARDLPGVGQCPRPRQSPHGATGVIAALGSAMVTWPDLRGVLGQCSRPRLRYVDDVVDTFVRAGCATPKTTGTYNIGTGQHTAFTEVHGVMSAVLDGSTPASARTTVTS